MGTKADDTAAVRSPFRILATESPILPIDDRAGHVRDSRPRQRHDDAAGRGHRLGLGDGRHADPPGPRRCRHGGRPVRPHGARPAAACDHRPEPRRAPADDQPVGPLDARVQRRDLQPPGRSGRNSNRPASPSGVTATPRHSWRRSIGGGSRRALERTNGMFAIAAWDDHHRRLVLARDRLGEKPLYWLHQGESLRVRQRAACAADPSRGRPADRPGGGGGTAPLVVRARIPGTIYAGVRQLPPGGLLEVSISDDDVAVDERSWWSLADTLDGALRRPIDAHARRGGGGTGGAARRCSGDAAGERRAARRVPVGGNRFLADLGARAARASRGERCGRSPSRCPNSASTSRRHAVDGRPTPRHRSQDGRPVARRCVRPHPAAADRSGTSRSPTPRCCRRRCSAAAAREQLTVCLGGDGGDELFAGYNRHVFGAVDVAAGRRTSQRACAEPCAAGMLAPSPRTIDRASDAVVACAPRRASRAERRRQGAEDGCDAPRRRARMGHARPGLAEFRSRHRTGAADRCRTLAGRLDERRAADARRHGCGPARPDAREGRPCEHGGVTRGPGALPRPPTPRVVVAPADVDQDVRRRRQGRAPAGRGKGAARRDRRSGRRWDSIHLSGAWLRNDLRPWASDLLAAPRSVSEGWIDGAAVRRTWAEHTSGDRNWDYRLLGRAHARGLAGRASPGVSGRDRRPGRRPNSQDLVKMCSSGLSRGSRESEEMGTMPTTRSPDDARCTFTGR